MKLTQIAAIAAMLLASSASAVSAASSQANAPEGKTCVRISGQVFCQDAVNALNQFNDTQVQVITADFEPAEGDDAPKHTAGTTR